jgi:hypothetical protein
MRHPSSPPKQQTGKEKKTNKCKRRSEHQTAEKKNETEKPAPIARKALMLHLGAAMTTKRSIHRVVWIRREACVKLSSVLFFILSLALVTL